MIELPGFVVDVLDPPASRTVASGGSPVGIRANVVMMCGCPTTSGGLWDADRYEIHAIVRRDSVVIEDKKLTYSGTPSEYAITIAPTMPGVYDILVYAYDAATGNTGIDRTTFTVSARQ